MDTRTRRVVLFCAGMIAAWIVAAVIAGQFVAPSPDGVAELGPGPLAPSDALALQLTREVVAGVFCGLIASFLELKVLPRYASRFGTGVMLVSRTVAYSIVGILSVFATVRFMARWELGVPARDVFSSDGFQSFVRSPEFPTLIGSFVLASFLISGGLQVARLLGPRTVTQILLGRYVRPRHEDRSFLFVDLVDSTGIAERLGPLKFAEFKNEFFHDIAEPVLDTRGQIVQYVGDEVLITWPTRRWGRPLRGDCVRCFFRFRDRIRQRASEYETRYGIVPRFRAGLHSGPVVVSQLGDIKREIVFSGDAVNTASRIQGLCRELGHDFIASSEVISDIELPDDVHQEELGEHSLRGRASPVTVVALRTYRS